MAPDELDSVDQGILYLLQQDARSNTITDIGERVGVSSSTVANRIKKLEARGVITGYAPMIDYGETGLGHHLLVGASVPLETQEAVVDDVMDIGGVVTVHELLTNRENVLVEFVGGDRAEVEQGISDLNSVGVDVRRTEILRQTRTQPYDHFGKQFTREGDAG